MDYETTSEIREALLSSCLINTHGCLTHNSKCDSKSFYTGKSSDWMMCNLDTSSSSAQNVEEEVMRLEALKSYKILDSEREQCFERITGLAARIFNAPIALVSFVDLGRQWFMSNRGLGDTRETPRSLAFCAHAILSKQDMLIVPNATEDPRFAENPLVTSSPHIRFYAGAPLLSPGNYKLGTLCIIDTIPRPEGLSLSDKQTLRELAALVVDSLVARKRERDVLDKDTGRIIAGTAHDLLTPLQGIQLNLSLLNDDDKLNIDDHQRDLIQSSLKCSDFMSRICHQSIQSFKGNFTDTNVESSCVGDNSNSENIESASSSQLSSGNMQEQGVVHLPKLFDNLRKIIQNFPKKVPLTINVSDDTPHFIKSDDLSIFRAALNLVSWACEVTEVGSIEVKVYVDQKGKSDSGQEHYRKLVFRCEDTAPTIGVEAYNALLRPVRKKSIKRLSCESISESTHKEEELSLSFYSTRVNVNRLNGDCGYSIRESSSTEDQCQGNVFWFSIPICDMDLPGPDRDLSNSAKKLEISREVDANQSPKQNSSTKRQSDQPCEQPSTSREDSCSSECKRMKNEDKVMKAEGEVMTALNVNKKIETGDSFTPKSSKAQVIQVERSKRTKRILVIDDSLTIRKAIDRAFTRLGFEVSQAENGMKGLKEMKLSLYDLVLCDFLMPVMDGLDCVKQYREWERKNRSWFKLYIIGISAHATSDDAKQGLRVGMNQFFSKPITLKSLKDLSSSKAIINATSILDKKYEETLDAHYREAQIISQFRDIENFIVDDMSLSSSSQVEQSTHLVCLLCEKSRKLVPLIESKGWRVCVAETGDDILRILKLRKWDIVFVDESMTNLSGMSCMVRFRKWESTNRIIHQNNVYYVSESFKNCDKEHKMCPDGFDGCLVKPFHFPQVSEILDQIADSRDTYNLTQI